MPGEKKQIKLNEVTYELEKLVGKASRHAFITALSCFGEKALDEIAASSDPTRAFVRALAQANNEDIDKLIAFFEPMTKIVHHPEWTGPSETFQRLEWEKHFIGARFTTQFHMINMHLIWNWGISFLGHVPRSNASAKPSQSSDENDQASTSPDTSADVHEDRASSS